MEKSKNINLGTFTLDIEKDVREKMDNDLNLYEIARLKKEIAKLEITNNKLMLMAIALISIISILIFMLNLSLK